jgi:O-6-methylguanine DNA methyltransferase
MAFWTSVDGQLADGEKLRVYIASYRGRIWRIIMSDARNPVPEDEVVRRFGAVDEWEPWPLGTGSGLLDAAAIQFEEYFSGRLLDFDLPLEFDGTEFQRTVWRQLTKLPYGETRTYGDIAKMIGKPSAMRAVGNANGRNNLPIIVPCHRVIGAGGNLCGFGGGIELKKSLLAHEAVVLHKRALTS